MDIENLHLEVTRNCTLECEHCLRGEKQCLYMGSAVIENVFKDVKRIRNLLLTGGEPLLAIKQLEHIALLMENNKIKIDSLTIITNGTVVSERILDILHFFDKHTHLSLRVSGDIFHILQLQKKGFTELREKNYRILQEQNFKDLSEYGKDESFGFVNVLQYKGRTRKLTQDRLNEINELAKQKHAIKPLVMDIVPIPAINKNKIYGYITIDVYGNLVGYGKSYAEEDKEAYDKGINVLDMSFTDAVRIYANAPKVEKKRYIFKSLIKNK